MAITKKGSRKITVNGIPFRWCITNWYEPDLGIVIQRSGDPGQRMTMWVAHGNVVTPGLVRQVILRAIDAGWLPGESGPDLFFKLEGLYEKGGEIPAGMVKCFGRSAVRQHYFPAGVKRRSSTARPGNKSRPLPN